MSVVMPPNTANPSESEEATETSEPAAASSSPTETLPSEAPASPAPSRSPWLTRRGLITVGSIVLLLAVICIGGPRLIERWTRDRSEYDARLGFSALLASAPTDAYAGGGEIALTEAQLDGHILANGGGYPGVEDYRVRIEPDRVVIVLGEAQSDLYSGRLRLAGEALVIEDVVAYDGWERFLSTSQATRVINQGLAGFFEARALRPVGLTQAAGSLTVTVAPAPPDED